MQWRSHEVWFGPLPSHPPFPFPPPLLPSHPPPLNRPHIEAKGSGEHLPSGSGLSLIAKLFLVHFKHYFNRERIENQISNSKIGVLIIIEHRMQQSQFVKRKDPRKAQKFRARTTGPSPLTTPLQSCICVINTL